MLVFCLSVSVSLFLCFSVSLFLWICFSVSQSYSTQDAGLLFLLLLLPHPICGAVIHQSVALLTPQQARLSISRVDWSVVLLTRSHDLYSNTKVNCHRIVIWRPAYYWQVKQDYSFWQSRSDFIWKSETEMCTNSTPPDLNDTWMVVIGTKSLSLFNFFRSWAHNAWKSPPFSPLLQCSGISVDADWSVDLFSLSLFDFLCKYCSLLDLNPLNLWVSSERDLQFKWFCNISHKECHIVSFFPTLIPRHQIRGPQEKS